MKFLLLPFSWLFGVLTYIRNWLYNRGYIKTYKSSIKSIVIGNLQVGGSGKTPMTAYLFDELKSHFKIAILSRGYGRKSKGLLVANASSSPADIGDEPKWYYDHLIGSTVVVAEKRQLGLQYLETTDNNLVLLDDAYQHRAITADCYLLLSEYSNPYFKDYPMPYGRMREYRTGDKRADAIIITKCPANLNIQEKIDSIKKINPLDGQEVYFTSLQAFKPVALKGNKEFNANDYHSIIALSGIANPSSFLDMCSSFGKTVIEKSFKDHHTYTSQDIASIESMISQGVCVICTEKDAVKLKEKDLFNDLSENAYFSLPVRPYFLFDEANKFKQCIMRAISQ